MDDFFDFSKEFTRTTVCAGYVNGRMAPDESDHDAKKFKRPHIGNDYAIEHRMKAENIMLEASMLESTSGCSRMDSIDDDSDSYNPKYKSEPLEIYKKYNFNTTDDINLPINSSKYNILNTIENNPTVILQGPTGCGKSTQVPQYILDEAKQQNKYCNIIVTQPRKIAAISLARRVCEERQWQVGTLVGFQVGLNANVHLDTRLLYCTTGILLQKLICTKSLTSFTHIILDEVHERDSDMDFLLIVIKKLLIESSNKVKIILMSATIDAMEFSEYFKMPRMGVFENAPIISVDRKRIFNVKEFYLCQLDRLKPNIDVNYDEPGISVDMYRTALQLISICGRFDNESSSGLNYKPSILVFLPGIHEIEAMFKTIEKAQAENSAMKELVVLPLHSTITTEEQAKIFYAPPPGCRKIILSTNIAESSITVPDIKYVIDFCLTKNLMTDPNTNFTGLKLQWASKANCNQRSGRAGRVMNGRVYRLVSKRFFDFHMRESGVPEILRCPLEQIVLKAKILDMGPPHSILALAMNPPDLSDIGNTILLLKSVGAMYQTVAGNYDVLDGDITYMGRIMAALPLEIHASKLIILGYIFNVFNDAIIIAAGLSVRNIFATPFNMMLQTYFQKLLWADGSGSDLFAILNAYKVWQNKKQQNLFENDETEYLWGKRYFVQIRAMKELSAQISEIKSRLSRFNMTEIMSNEKFYWTNQEKYLVLKIAICGAFYPYYFNRSSVNEREAFQVLGGLDPSKTIYFKGMDPKYIGILYEKRIKEILKPIEPSLNDIKMTFDPNSQRLFATFLKGDQFFNNNKKSDQELKLINSMPGHILLEVYKACKMAKINGKHTIEVLTPSEAIKFAQNQQIGVIENGTWQPKKEKIRKLYRITPGLNEKEMNGTVQFVEHCSKFYFQPNSTLNALKQIHDILTPERLVPFIQPSDINESEIIAAPYSSDYNDNVDHISYYRVKVLGFDKAIADTKYILVYYIDYGNKGSVKFSDLRRAMFLDELKNIPPCVFECRLCGIQPSCFVSPQELWTDKTIKELHDFNKNAKMVTIEIYSFVNGIASVRLKKGNICINDILVEKGLAQIAEESYMSKANHELRERKQTSQTGENVSDSMNNEDEDLNVNDVNPPPKELCHHRVTILGPYSPLETQMYSLMKYAEYNSAKIDPQSINSILLDTLSTSDAHNLIVAAEVGSLANSTLIARSTTLMPNIKGFGVLMGLLFCPTMELKRDPKNTRYAAALTGLGYNKKTLEPFDPEHDILFKMDVEITMDDIEIINATRYYIDALLHTFPGEEHPQLDENTKIQIMNKIHENLPKILEKPRQSVEEITSSRDNEWGNIKDEDMVKMKDVFGFRTILPVHAAATLEEPKTKDTLRLKNNCSELHKICNLNFMNNPFTCLLCNLTLENVTQARIHLYTCLHVDREKQINFKI